MGTNERREREKQEVRRKILDAARSLFAKDGYEKVTMRRIADAIEYSPATIYLHFADKDALIRELCESDFLELAQAVVPLLAIDDPLARLRALGRAYLEFGLTHPHHYRLMFMEAPPYDEIPTTQLVQKGNPETDAYALLLSCIQDAMGRGLLRADLDDAELVTQTVWSGMHGVVALHNALRDDKWVSWRTPEARGDLMVECLLRGLART